LESIKVETQRWIFPAPCAAHRSPKGIVKERAVDLFRVPSINNPDNRENDIPGPIETFQFTSYIRRSLNLTPAPIHDLVQERALLKERFYRRHPTDLHKFTILDEAGGETAGSEQSIVVYSRRYLGH
jgi:hypothetical protein